MFFLILFLPLSFVIGPAAVEVNIFFINIIFLYSFFKKKFPINFDELFSLFVVFIFFALISSLFNSADSLSFIKGLFYLRFFILALAIKYFYENNSDLLKITGYVFLTVMLLVSITGLLEYLGFNLFQDVRSNYNNRISGVFGDELILGSYLLKFFFITFGILLVSERLSLITIFILVFSGLIIFISNERINTLLFVCALIIFFFLTLKKPTAKVLFISITIIGLSFIIYKNQSSWIKFYNYIILSTPLQKIVKLEHDEKQYPIRTYGYFKLFDTAIETSKLHFPLGVGVRNFRNECKIIIKNKGKKNYICDTHPHNIYFEILSETGFFGLVCFVLFLFFLIKKNIGNHIELKLRSLNYVILFVLFWPLATSGSFFNNFYAGLIWINISFYFVFTSKNIKSF